MPRCADKRAMRLLQHCAGPHDDAVEIAAAERDRRHIDHLLGAVAQHRHAHLRLLHGALDFAEAVHDDAVDVEDQIARTQQLRGRRTADQPRDAQHLPTLRAVLLHAR